MNRYDVKTFLCEDVNKHLPLTYKALTTNQNTSQTKYKFGNNCDLIHLVYLLIMWGDYKIVNVLKATPPRNLSSIMDDEFP